MYKTMPFPMYAAGLGALAGYNAARRRTGKGYLRSTRTMRSRRAGYMASRYRPRFKKSSKKAWQARARRQVAVPRNYSTAKTTESVNPTASTILLNKLDVRSLITIEKGTEINQRTRDTCVISGIKLNLAFKNLEETRLFINWAVIHPKQGQVIDPNQPEFFRDYTDVRAWDANSGAKTGLSWSVAQINSDDYVILKRGKFMLVPSTGTSVNPAVSFNTKDSEKSISCWCKLGRSFTFTNDVVPVPNDPIYFVCWAADPNGAAGTNIGLNGFTYRLRSIVYFREPKTG